MADCCTNHDSTINKPQEQINCPQCEAKGKKVDIITLKSLLVPNAMKHLDSSGNYNFCSNANCSVVYFNGTNAFTKDKLTVRVFQKETSHPIPVCYCFGITKEQISEEMKRTGNSGAFDEVTQYVKDKKCACEIRNPQGSCCLGNIKKVANEAFNQRQKSAPQERL